ncbi:DsbA family protein [Novosphingobium piscinae]|uniref:DsbA family protein n=1 Tax=Novosphingobium piscinae TaxID=1507448 RepID=A0A7X1KQW8_9SPHN|nr:DsbA family protein [Novosphingobium piscinae]MBC2670003.1 DsbA family protein [Novosphingobium piscinae]
MSDPATRLRAAAPILLIALACAALGALGGWYWEARRLRADPAARLATADRAAIEQVVHDYLMAHPEVLPKAMEALERRATADRLGAVRGAVERAHPGAVLGNPAGKVVMVEFTDYACGYCRGSVADVEALIAANPDLKVVVREMPILTPESADAARMALAAAAQGRYAAFHKAMFAAGRPTAQTIAAAARAAGIDPARARQTIAAPETQAELDRNLELARQLGFSGTPSWVIGDLAESGAIGREALGAAIAQARS